MGSASGHVDKFEDLMVRDVETKEPYRADHLLEGILCICMACCALIC